MVPIPRRGVGNCGLNQWVRTNDCPYIDNLGNLCLVSKSSNSRLSDRDVKEKVEVYGHGNLGPNRQVVYAKTASDEEKGKWAWGEKQSAEHYNEIAELIDQREKLLNVNLEVPK